MQIMVFSFVVCFPVCVHSCTFAGAKSDSMLDEDGASVG